jgi:pimeloyl-ACP methyl ester carboxylesterase
MTDRLAERIASANERFNARVREFAAKGLRITDPHSLWKYSIDLAQRTILFWDTLRRRGNNFLEHERAGKPPVLHFEHEMVMDGRQFERPVNYALLRIKGPPETAIDPKKRPYVIIDPRAGHGPGIGGFKDDSQVGVALRGGHPVYFVVFFPEPEPGQTLLDVCAAEAQFVRRVRELHPESHKPVVVGNCQGGWAAMLLAASSPEHTGPVVINGAPMSYWGGDGNNPMRYVGGLLGGSWLASLAADLGNGRFDGAHLVQGFESLDPANSLWEKYRHLLENPDTEAERFLDFERWWGGFYLLSREEIEWITQNLFVGNKLASGELKSAAGKAFDLREIRSPIILFASLGDHITPPQQAFNWVADVYGSTEEVKARGQVIVGLLHRSVGHLGIFVAGHVAKKEHAQLVEVLDTIEALPPGVYGMEIKAREGGYDVQFVEYRLEDVMRRLNRGQRADEAPFEVVSTVSEFNQRMYEIWVRPFVQSAASEGWASLFRGFHPLRLSRWAWSDLNPWLWWLGPAAAAVKHQRVPLEPGAPLRSMERDASDLMSAMFDYWRDVRDAVSEAAFYRVYGGILPLTRRRRWSDAKQLPHELPLVKQILERIGEGGYAEAVGRVAALMRTVGEPLPLSGVEARHAFALGNVELLPKMAFADLRRVEGEQDIIVREARERAIQTLPALVREPADAERLGLLLERAAAFRNESGGYWLNEEQRALAARIREALAAPLPRIRPPVTTAEVRLPAARSPAKRSSGRR